jgi:hypothetical protein
MAGTGIEYTWAYAKDAYKKFNAEGGEFKGNVARSLSDEVVPLAKIWITNRRSRDYMRVYIQIINDCADGTILPSDVSYEMLERMRKEYHSHRNMKEIDGKFLKNHEQIE